MFEKVLFFVCSKLLNPETMNKSKRENKIMASYIIYIYVAQMYCKKEKVDNTSCYAWNTNILDDAFVFYCANISLLKAFIFRYTLCKQ